MPIEIIRCFSNPSGRSVVDFVDNGDVGTLLTIGGETAFQAAQHVCETCEYIFTKVGPADQLGPSIGTSVAEELSFVLRDVPAMPDQTLLSNLAMILAPGDYTVVLARFKPHLVMPGEQDDYFATEAVATWGVDQFFGVGHWAATPYYRLGGVNLGPVEYGGHRLGLVLSVPLYPPTQAILNREDVIAEYRHTLRAGEETPTVLALGLAEDRGPATWNGDPGEFSRHLVAALYVLDGHHKLGAAAAERVPVQFLVFLPHRVATRDAHSSASTGADLLRTVSALTDT